MEETEQLGVLVLRDKVLFPKVPCTITLTRQGAKDLVAEAAAANKPVVVVCQNDKSVETPKPEDIYTVGVKAVITSYTQGKEPAVVLDCQTRVNLTDIMADGPFLRATVTERPDSEIAAPLLIKETVAAVREKCAQIVERTKNFPPQLGNMLNAIEDDEMFIHYCASNLPAETNEIQTILELDSLFTRAEKVNVMMLRLLSMQELIEEFKRKTDEFVAANQREYFLQQQMKVIRKELGDTSAEDINRLREQGNKKNWSEAVHERYENELKRLERTSQQSSEYAVQEQYLETLLSLPWDTYTKDNNNLKRAQKVLDQDHFGIEKVKERILEFLACPNRQGVILCLYGPPGVGKTSLCKSIAKALGREYARVSLGGMHDEAEIRGHRRTYVGAMPGRIIKNLSKVKASNPVFVLDEIDKMCNDYHGDPTSALLEVLDPEQNRTFHDNYLDMDYDLSNVLFIATANSLQSVPRPLLDRMELIEMTGYLQEEKEQIAKKYLVPKRLEEQQLDGGQFKFAPDGIRTIVNEYTRESGVRELDRQIAAVIRKALKRKALEQNNKRTLPATNEQTNIITADAVHSLLGKPKYTRDKYEGNDYTGCVTGLAWTQVGGELLTIETTLFPAKTPTLTLTGNLGDVMKESATIALTYIKAHATEYDIDTELFEKKSVHLHVPEGAIPKDGPSAGITMTTAMVSAMTGRKVRAKIAMTGEMTLRGKVLPVGGIKEKILAAKQAGITDIVLCHENEKDILDIPEAYLKGLTFHYVKDAKEVIAFALQ